MEVFAPFLESMDHPGHRARMEEVLGHILERFPELAPRIAWNQPMFTHHDTFIIGFSAAKDHIAVAPEMVVIERFSDAIKKAGYSRSKGLFRIPWDHPVDYELLDEIIRHNILDKAECSTFWRK